MKHFITLSLLLTLSINLWGQDTWVKTFGGKGGEVKGESIISTSDGGVLITGPFWETKGDFKGMEKGGTDVFVIKLDKDGEVVWKKVYGGSVNEDHPVIKSTSDDGIVITGETSSNDGDFEGMSKGGEDIFVMKLDKDGEVMWKKSFGGTDDERRPHVCTYPNGDILIMGSTSSNDGDFKGMNKGNGDIFVIKLDKDGEVVWKKVYGGSNPDLAKDVTVYSQDGGILVTGQTMSNDGNFEGLNNHGYPIFVMKLDKDGEVVWRKILFEKVEFYDYEYCRRSSVATTSDDGVLFIGWNLSVVDEDVVAIKLDKDGEFVWKKVHGCPDLDEANDVTVTSDDGMLIVGLVSELVELVDGLGNGEESYESDIKLFKLDKDGDKLWERSFGGKGKKEGGSSITTTPDGHILITGTTDSNDGDFKGMNKGYTDVFVMKLDSNGNLKPSGKKKSKKK